MRRIPSLDGLRAVSIAFVLLGHLSGTRGFPFIIAGSLAELGVRVFFVISGFLITSLLVSELEKTGTIQLGEFYLRRTLRIFPPYYAMLAVVGVVTTIGAITLNRGDLLHAITYTTNYHPDRSWWLGHTWSLAVEEQFYLLWPATLLFFGLKRGMRVAAVLLIAAPLIRLGEWYGGAHNIVGNSFETVADALATGCLLACSRSTLWNNARYRALLASRWFLIVPAIALALTFLDRPRIQFAIGITLSNLCIAATIDWCVRNSQSRIGRVLNAQPIAFVGLLSYSLYLWQQLFVNRTGTSAANAFPLNIVFAFGVALASYYAVERPALRLRARYHRSKRIVAREAAVMPRIEVEHHDVALS